MRRRLVTAILTASFIPGILFTGCDSKPSSESDPGDGSTVTKETTEGPTEASPTPTPTPSPTPTPTEIPEPTVSVVTSNMYDGIVVHTDWSSYTPYSAEAPESVYTRLRDDYIDEFYPSGEYGHLFPFLGESRMLLNNDRDNRYGLIDINGRIVCDPVFYSISEIPNLDLYITTTISPEGTRKYGVLKRDGSFYSGQVYDHDYEYNDGNLIMLKRLPDMLLVTVYGEGCETVIPE